MGEIRRVTFPVQVLPFQAAGRRLAAGVCPAFFPADVILQGEQMQVFYHTEGYRQLRGMRNVPASALLEIIKGILKQLDTCRDWLWMPEEMVLSVDTIFVNEEYQIRILYIPEKKSVSENRRLTGLLHTMKGIADEEGIMYLETCMKLVSVDNLRTCRILAFLDHLAMNVHR
ncbi:MAG: DUF6382 domain-containing protein [Anaerovoracaceae bacterium]|nr:DUF6382 domain-containing protein [Anaerovoracaceae bacterium]